MGSTLVTSTRSPGIGGTVVERFGQARDRVDGDGQFGDLAQAWPGRPGAIFGWRSWRPSGRRAVPVLFAVWALAGLYGALGPALVHALTGSGDVVLGALSLFVLASSAVVATIVLRRVAARMVMLSGLRR